MKKVIFALITMTLILGCRQDVSFAPTPDYDRLANISEDQPPVVRVLQPALDQIEGYDNQVVFEVIPGDNPIQSVDCYVDGVKVDCDSSSGVINITTPGKGPHEVIIIAKDDEGLEGEGSDDWVVHDRFVRNNENVSVSAEERQSDILFVIDNSGSMSQEQTEMANKIINFFSKLNGLNWRVAITTTDADGTGHNEDGRIVKFSNNKYFLDSSLSIGTAKNLFAETIQQGTTGSAHERGIFTTRRAIERAVNPTEIIDNKLKDFFREDAALSVVVISDETEALEDFDKNPLHDLHKSDGDNLINYVKSSWGTDKLFQYNSIIAIPGDSGCLESGGGTAYKYGVAYDALSRKTNGVVASICSADYSESLKLIGTEVAGLQTTYQLGCYPQDVDRDGIIDLEVNSKNGKTVPGYVINGDKLVFDKPLKVGDYSFHYFCLNSIP